MFKCTILCNKLRVFYFLTIVHPFQTEINMGQRTRKSKRLMEIFAFFIIRNCAKWARSNCTTANQWFTSEDNKALILHNTIYLYFMQNADTKLFKYYIKRNDLSGSMIPTTCSSITNTDKVKAQSFNNSSIIMKHS